jgi:hypothetical protein
MLDFLSHVVEPVQQVVAGIQHFQAFWWVAANSRE